MQMKILYWKELLSNPTSNAELLTEPMEVHHHPKVL
jgi:hypothetical protein